MAMSCPRRRPAPRSSKCGPQIRIRYLTSEKCRPKAPRHRCLQNVLAPSSAAKTANSPQLPAVTTAPLAGAVIVRVGFTVSTWKNFHAGDRVWSTGIDSATSTKCQPSFRTGKSRSPY